MGYPHAIYIIEISALDLRWDSLVVLKSLYLRETRSGTFKPLERCSTRHQHGSEGGSGEVQGGSGRCLRGSEARML